GVTSGFIRLAGPAAVNGTTGSAIAAFFSGSAGLNKSGSGTLVLAGINNYTGGTNITGGAIQVTQNNSIPAGNALTINSGVGAALVLGTNTISVTSLTMTGLT